jgi:hypothetical protein
MCMKGITQTDINCGVAKNSEIIVKYSTITGLIPRSPQLQVKVMIASLGSDVTSRRSTRGCVRVDQCVSAVRATEVSVFVCLRSS